MAQKRIARISCHTYLQIANVLDLLFSSLLICLYLIDFITINMGIRFQRKNISIKTCDYSFVGVFSFVWIFCSNEETA